MPVPKHSIDIRFEVLFDAMPTACLLCDKQGNILLANPAAQSLLLQNAEDLLKKNIRQLMPDLHLPEPDKLKDIPEHTLHGTITPHGSPQHVIAQWVTIDDSTDCYVLIAISNDRRRQAELALQSILQAALPAADDASDQLKLSTLTEREREVMSLAVAGYHNKEIARALGISHRTVEIHKSRIMHKTGASNLLDLARIATAAHLITIS